MRSALQSLRIRSDAGRPPDETGFVLITALMVLTILLLLSGALVTASVHFSQSSTREHHGSAALAAANAGLHVATYRLNAYDELNTAAAAWKTKCFTTEYTEKQGGVCPAVKVEGSQATNLLGNGATYEYTISPVLEGSSHCAGPTVTGTVEDPVDQRCVTSIGRAGGVTARVQERVAGREPVPSAAPFPFEGILALNKFHSNNVVEVTGAIGSNKKIEMDNGSVDIKGDIEYYAGAGEPYVANDACKSPCELVSRATQFAVPTDASATAAAFQAAAESNKDSAVAWPTMSEGPIYTPSTHVLKTPAAMSAPVKLEGGTYYFCNMEFNGAADFETVGSTPVKIYVDSSKRSGSSCSGVGGLLAANAFTFKNTSDPANPNDLQFYFWGEPDCTTSCPQKLVFNNAVGSASEPLIATIFAPYIEMRSANGLYMDGGMVLGDYEVDNALHLTDAGLSSVAGGGAAAGEPAKAFYSAGYQVCLPASTPEGSTC